MKRFVWIMAGLLIVSCESVKGTTSGSEAPKMEYIETGNQNFGGLKGVVTDKETNEPVPFANVRIMKQETLVTGAQLDFDGKFIIREIQPGEYDVHISSIGYEPLIFENVVVKPGQMLEIEGTFTLYESQVIELKPMIYLYPEKETEVSVSLNYDGELTHTYPKSEGSWRVTASPDGTLVDSTGRSYYGLFWEGVPNEPIIPNCGTVVSKDSLIPFLETSLDQLGLNQREANEFIVFWLPILEQAPFNLIYFAGEDYTNHALLEISPKPVNIIRIMMGYAPLQRSIEFPSQTLPDKPKREGFTVVEWGGSACGRIAL